MLLFLNWFNAFSENLFQLRNFPLDFVSCTTNLRPALIAAYYFVNCNLRNIIKNV